MPADQSLTCTELFLWSCLKMKVCRPGCSTEMLAVASGQKVCYILNLPTSILPASNFFCAPCTDGLVHQRRGLPHLVSKGCIMSRLINAASCNALDSQFSINSACARVSGRPTTKCSFCYTPTFHRQHPSSSLTLPCPHLHSCIFDPHF